MTGNYTDIVQVIAPASAMPGELVAIEAKIKITFPGGTILITATGRVDSTVMYFGGKAYYGSYGSIQSFYESFVMPDEGVTIYVWSWYMGVDSAWHQDDEAIITIPLTGVTYPPSDIADFNLIIPTRTYLQGETANFTGSYKHKGAAMPGTLVISLGTGIFPTFSTVYTFDPITVLFSASQDWESADLSGSIILPTTLIPGQTYSVRATLRTEDGAQEIDTDWGVITIAEEGAPPDVETLEVDITPLGKGHVVTDPASEEGKTIWHNNETGTFPYGTNVKVTAVPADGYVFEKWSDEIVGGVSYQNPSYVQAMTEHRVVKCHFRVEELGVETLEVDITPLGKGYVTTVPASEEGKTTWHHDETGTFSYGTDVQVTAHPSEGYVFEKWSDEIVGGVSYDNPAYVQPMTEYRAVKAHFIVEEEEPLLRLSELTVIDYYKKV